MLKKNDEENIVTIYLLYPGYIKHVINIARQLPKYKFNVFLNFGEVKSTIDNVTVFKKNRKKFLESMSISKILLTTAGVETIIECTYIGKKIIVIPTESHFEQKTNAISYDKYTENVFYVKSFKDYKMIINIINDIKTNNYDDEYTKYVKNDKRIELLLNK